MIEKYFDKLFECDYDNWTTEYIGKSIYFMQFLKTLENHCNYFKCEIGNINKQNILFIENDYYINKKCLRYNNYDVFAEVYFQSDGLDLILKIKNNFYINSKYLLVSTKFNSKIKEQLNIKINQKTYIMYDLASDLYKIGKSVNIEFREKTLAGYIPKIKTILYLESDIERQLHILFSNKRQRGEWFNLSADDILLLIEKYKFKQL